MADQKDREIKDEKTGQISRREFLKDAGLVVGGAAVGSMGILSACSTTKTVTDTNSVTKTVTNTSTVTAPGGTGVTTVTVTAAQPVSTGAQIVQVSVNGHAYKVQVEPEWTLQYLLHEVMGWTDVKDMCVGYGACGSCTVILEGRPVLSCMALAIECDGMTIQTAQGIAQVKHPVIDSYTKYHTWQCGYCTPGFVVTAKALLDRNPNPTDAEAADALGGNLCRCGTYPQHILAVKDAASTLAGGK